MWFRFLHITFWFFVVCTILSTPVFLMAVQGRRIAASPQERTQDAFGFSLISVGNLGPSREDGTCNGNCSASTLARIRTTPILPGESLELADASLIVSGCDAAVTLALMVFLFVFFRTIRQVEDQIADNNLEASNFAVMVRGLPPDATKEDVLEHFDRLYNLRQPDWTFKGYCCGCCMAKYPSQARPVFSKPKRSRVTGELKAAHDAEGVVVAPVLNATNTGDPTYLKRWVAEVTIARPNGGLILRYRRMQRRQMLLRRARAAVKMFSRPSPYANAARLEVAKNNLLAVQKRMEAVDDKLSRKYKHTAVAAFVVFNAEESRRRAVFDYAWSTNCCLRCCQPEPLLFRRAAATRGQPIIVTPAPDPADILWENLEATAGDRCCRQCISYCGMLLVIVCSLIALVAARTSANNVEADAPSFAVCGTSVVQAATGLAEPSPGFAVYRDTTRDVDCPTGTVSVYVANFTDPANPTPAPLIAGTDPHNCSSFCVSQSDQTTTCGTGSTTFKKRDLIGCHCMALLTLAQEDGALVTALAALSAEQLCIALAASIANTNALRAGAAMTVVVVNIVLRIVSENLSRFERHVSVGELQSAKVVKILLLTFINTAVITAIVNASIKGDAVPLWITNLLGDVEGFEPRWFAVAGSAIVLTMALNVLSLNIGVILRFPGMLCCSCSRNSAKVMPETMENDPVMEMMYNPGPLEVDEKLFDGAGTASRQTKRHFAEAVEKADEIRIAQSSSTCCDRCTATFFSCFGPQQACECIRACCDNLPELLRCWCCCRGARARAAVTQSELEELVEVETYDVAQRWPLALNTFFVTMTYGAGIPLLYPIAAIAFAASFNMEKCALLRFTRQPPIMDSSLARLSLRLMPLAVLIHLVMTIVIFNDAALLESRSVFERFGDLDGTDTLNSWYSNNVDSTSGDALISFASRMQREAIIIPLLLLFIFVLAWVIKAALGPGCRSCCTSCFVVCCCGRPCVDTRVVDEFKSNPPFTGLYAQPLARGVRHTLGAAEEDEGFRIERDKNVRGDRTAQRKIKVWTESGVTYGKAHEEGERMMTWETIADVGIASYDPTANPAYAEAFLAMEKAVDRASKQLDLMRMMIQFRAKAMGPVGSGHTAGADDGDDHGGDMDVSSPTGLDDDHQLGWDIPDDESVGSSVGSAANKSRSRRASHLDDAE